MEAEIREEQKGRYCKFKLVTAVFLSYRIKVFIDALVLRGNYVLAREESKAFF
jgi:hypothetical protein